MSDLIVAILIHIGVANGVQDVTPLLLIENRDAIEHFKNDRNFISAYRSHHDLRVKNDNGSIGIMDIHDID